MSLVCLDTQILSFGLLKKKPRGNEHLVHAAEDFIDWLDKRGDRILLPTVVLAELLVAVPADEARDVLQLIRKQWQIASFDPPAAVKFAELRRNTLARADLRRMANPDTPGATREALKADLMIIATAVTHKAEVLYTHNDHVISLAQGAINAFKFTDVDFPRKLPFPRDE